MRASGALGLTSHTSTEFAWPQHSVPRLPTGFGEILLILCGRRWPPTGETGAKLASRPLSRNWQASSATRIGWRRLKRIA